MPVTVVVPPTLLPVASASRKGSAGSPPRRASTAASLGPDLEALPGGLDTVVGSGGHALTEAQAQQLALARLVLADPHTLVLDEATSALDAHSEALVQEALHRLTRGRTTIVIARHLETMMGEVEAVRRMFEIAGVKVAGAILNGYKASEGGRYGSQYQYSSYRYSYKSDRT